MSQSHICERDKCPSKHVSGPTTKCIVCLRTFYLLCFGFSKCGPCGIRSKVMIGNAHFAMEPKSITFICGACDVSCLVKAMETPPDIFSPKDHNKSFSRSDGSFSNPVSNSELKKDLLGINSLLKVIKQTVNANSNDLAEIKQMSTNVYRTTKPLNSTSVVSEHEPLSTPKLTTFSQIMIEQREQNRQSAKRSASAMKTPTNSKTENTAAT